MGYIAFTKKNYADAERYFTSSNDQSRVGMVKLAQRRLADAEDVSPKWLTPVAWAWASCEKAN
jgi:hypothetical protein